MLCSHAALADNLVEIQPLNVGKWAITNNTGLRYITVQPNGSYSSSPQLVMLEPPQAGIYRITGIPPFASVSSVDVTLVQPLQGGNQDFNMTNFQVVHTNANGAGEVMVNLGLTVKTNGSGQPYDDATYTGVLEFDVNL